MALQAKDRADLGVDLLIDGSGRFTADDVFAFLTPYLERDAGLTDEFGPQLRADDIMALLRIFGAPEPWQAAERCKDVAKLLSGIDVVRQTVRKRIQAHRRARTAAIELRKQLPELIVTHIVAGISAPVMDGPLPGEEPAWREAKRETIQRLMALVEILDVEFPAAKRPLSEDIIFGFPTMAWRLLIAYRIIVGSSSMYKHGPAAPFIASALSKAGFTATGGRGAVTPASVEEALRRLVARMTANRHRQFAVMTRGARHRIYPPNGDRASPAEKTDVSGSDGVSASRLEAGS